MSSFLKDLLSIGLSKGGVIIFSLLQGVIIARWLGPELNGVISALLVYPSLFMTIGSLGIRQSTTYYIAKGLFTEKQIKAAISQIWIFTTIISVIGSYFLITNFSNSGSNLVLVILALLPIPFVLFNTYNSGVFLGKNQIQTFNKINWLPPLFVLIGTIILVIVFELSIRGAMISLIFGPALMSIIMLFKNDFLQAFSIKFEIRVIKSLLSLGIVYALALLVINLNYKLDIILLDKFSTNYETGIYGKGAGLIQYLWQIPMLLSTIVFARSAIAKNQQAFSIKVCQLLRVSIIIIGLASVFLGFLAPFIINLLYGAKFIDSADVLIYLIPGVVLLTIFKVLNMDMAGRGKPWISLKPMVPALIVNVILNILLIPRYGANGAAVASTLSYSLAAILFLHFYSKQVEIPVREILAYSKSDFNPFFSILKKNPN
ncbi:flippase [Salinimicrobium marinum]|uniref:Flippase n=1 Tax=Salinimicrobium marinum TaxID=680283 RepID=A0A918SKH6_9FLAO|nr:polysaccharide biosynthesis C-terminal domain-containing protein [Salinimicrobium marinum]GHA46264.1 flippase [Salinimicrobium marinum]